MVTVTDGLADAETLGEQAFPVGQDLAWAIGNHVVIEHDDGVFSCLAHLKRTAPLPVELTAEGETCAPVGGQLLSP